MTNLTTEKTKNTWEVLATGYLPLKGKVPTQAHKGLDGVPFDEANQFPEFGGKLKGNIIMIDIDDLKTAELVLTIITNYGINCTVIESDNRGMHFYFRNSGVMRNGTNVNLALGIKSDIKIGQNQVIAPVKTGGEFRRILRDSQNPDQLPIFLKPVNVKEGSQIIDDGARNDSMFRHIGRLKAQGFRGEDIAVICELINNHIFEKPLTDTELKNILRDDILEEKVETKIDATELVKEKGHPHPSMWFSTDQDKRFKHEALGKYMMDYYNIMNINGRLHGYFDNSYFDIEKTFGNVVRRVYISITEARVIEVFKFIQAMAPIHDKLDERYINFKNGVLDTQTWELLPHNKKHITINQVDRDYDTSAVDPSDIWTKFMSDICGGDQEKINLIQEYAGYCFYRSTRFQKCMIFYGPGGNGKSTFLEALRYAMNERNCVAMDIRDLSEKFRTQMIYNKMMMLADDLNDGYIKDTSVLKKVVTGNGILFEKKGKDSLEFTPYAKIFAGANTIPRFGDTGDSMYRRLLIVNLDKSFKDSPDTTLKTRLETEECAKYIIKWAITGLKRLIDNNGFSTCGSVSDAIEEFKVENNPFIYWLTEEGDLNVSAVTTKEAYRSYKVFCEENGFQAFASNTFGRKMAAEGFTKIRRKRQGKDLYFYEKAKKEDK